MLARTRSSTFHAEFADRGAHCRVFALPLHALAHEREQAGPLFALDRVARVAVWCGQKKTGVPNRNSLGMKHDDWKNIKDKATNSEFKTY